MKLKLLALVVLLTVGVGAVVFAMGGIAAAGSDATRYLTAQVVRGTVTQEVSATGTVASSASYALEFGQDPQLASASSSSSSGGSTTWHVDKLDVKLGDAVKKGEVLARANTADLQTQLVQATATWNAAKIQLVIAQDQRDDASTTSTIRQTRIGVYNAQNAVSQAAKARADLMAQIRAATLTSPIDGVVTAINVVAGVQAPSGTAIVVSAATFDVTASVVESDLSSIKSGQPVAITVSAVNASLTGKVSSIGLTPSTTGGSSSVVSYPVTITIDGNNTAVRAGMSADVSITVAKAANVLVVPTSALTGSRGSYVARVLDEANNVSTVPVAVGLVTINGAEIKSGLDEGETVVTGTVSNQTNGTTNSRGLGGGGFSGGFGGGGGGGFVNPGGGKVIAP
jgi:macrolide-specific efflux system membrane fusion protein